MGTSVGRIRSVVVVLVLALLSSACGSPPNPSPTGAVIPTPKPGETPAPGQTPGPSAPTGDWAAVDLPPLTPVASLEPTKSGAAGAATDTAFTLKSLDGTPVADLAAGLTVEPQIELRADAPTADAVLLRPTAALTSGTTYRFRLARADGTIAGSWAITAAKPLHVVGTIPGDRTADAPIDTGIEIAFDQAGVTADDLKAHFTISPAVVGRFEAHGRTLAFVPDKPLQKLTVYTVTISQGLPLPGTDETLRDDVVVKFETAGKAEPDLRLFLSDKLMDSAVKDAPLITVAFVDRSEEGVAKQPKRLPVTVHRLAGIDAAIAAYRALAGTGDWARSDAAPIKTGSLPEVFSGTLRFRPFYDDALEGWLALPDALAAGWYVATITFDGLDSQVLIQVTDVATYAMVTSTDTVIWTNDARTGGPLAGTRIDLGTTSLGRTDADGLRRATTPEAAKTTPGETDGLILTARDALGRSMFVPIDRRGVCEKCPYGDDFSDGSDDIDAWWHVVGLDRTLFRATDTADVWGMVRARDGGALPRDVEVRLVVGEATDTTLPIVTKRVKTSPSGAWIAELPFKDLPPSEYRIEVLVDGTQIDGAYLTVQPFVKPAYTLEVTPTKRAMLAGETIQATVKAAFFEGTPVAGVDLATGFTRYDEAWPAPRRSSTDVSGLTTVTTTAPRFSDENDGDEQWTWRQLSATPQLPEEARIEGSTLVAVFRSTALLGVSADIADTRLTATGTVNDVAFSRFKVEGEPFEGGVDPVGAPRAGARVGVRVVEILTIRRQSGTTYDLITKRVVPTYQYDERRTTVASDVVRTAADGTYRVAFDVKGGNSRLYEIHASYTDEDGRRITAVTYADPDAPMLQGDSPFLSVPGHESDQVLYSIGDTVKVVFRGGHPESDKDRYLFTVSQRGLGFAVVQSGPRFSTTFRAASVPNKHIEGVRWVHGTYEVTAYGYDAIFDAEDRRLDVRISTDAARYEPGGRVAVAIRTTDGAGAPVAASVIVRAIDEKLYAMGAADAIDPLLDLYRQISTGVIARAWSHAVPTLDGDGGGDTTGGGGDDARSDFRDQLLFKVVETDASGRGTVAFDLSDDLTSWRISAAAVDTSYRAGSASIRVPVGVPFFAEAAVAPEYLLADRPIMRLRGFGSALTGADTVSFEVSSSTLGMAATTRTAAAFKTAEVALPALSLGDHDIRIVATTGSGSSRRQDILIRRIRVVESRSVQSRTTSALVGDGYAVPGSPGGLTTLSLTDAGRGRVLPLLLSSDVPSTSRGDDALAAMIARDALQASFGRSPDAGLPTIDLSAFQFPGGGLGLFPYASEDLELSALGAVSADPRLDPAGLGTYFRDRVEYDENGEEIPQTRERRIIVLTGRAGLGEPVLDEIRAAAAEPTLEPTERAWLALAALAAGDETLAATLERDLLRDHGERLGPWVRVSLPDRETGITTTAIVGIVAAGVGDPLAADLDAYLEANPAEGTLLVLQRVLAARYWAQRTPGTAGAVSMTVDGATQELAVDPEAPVWLSFTPAQLSGLRLTTVRGSVLAVSTWDGPLDATTFIAPSGVTFTRDVTPTGPIAADGVVTVDLTVRLPMEVDHGCWRVTDLAPSGLAPLAAGASWFDSGEDEEEEGAIASARVESPWRIVGQRVDFCVTPDKNQLEHHLRYRTRVVTPGSYRWESAVLQSSIVPEQGIVVPGFDLRITPIS